MNEGNGLVSEERQSEVIEESSEDSVVSGRLRPGPQLLLGRLLELVLTSKAGRSRRRRTLGTRRKEVLWTLLLKLLRRLLELLLLLLKLLLSRLLDRGGRSVKRELGQTVNIDGIGA